MVAIINTEEVSPLETGYPDSEADVPGSSEDVASREGETEIVLPDADEYVSENRQPDGVNLDSLPLAEEMEGENDTSAENDTIEEIVLQESNAVNSMSLFAGTYDIIHYFNWEK